MKRRSKNAKKGFTMVFALLLIILMAVQSAYTLRVSAASDDTFYQELAKLLNEQDFTNSFGKMELQIGNNKLTNDGEIQILDVAPEIVNGRTMLPIRAVAETAGATVEWIQETATVSIESAYGDEICCSIGSDRITINNASSEMDVSPYIKAGRTYLPLRAVSEALELEELVHSRPNSEYYIEAWDYYPNGVFQHTRYCIVSL